MFFKQYLLLFLIPLYCARFQVFNLTSTVLVNIPLVESNNISQSEEFIIPVLIKENLIFNVPQNPIIYKKELLLPFPENNFYAYFEDYTEQPAFIITSAGAKPEIEKIYKKIPIYTFSSGIIGSACINDNYFLLQIFQKKENLNSLESEEPENRLPAVLYPETKDINPYSIFIVYKQSINPKQNNINLIPIEKDKTYTDILDLFCFSNSFATVRIQQKEAYVQFYNTNLTEKVDFIINSQTWKEQNRFIFIENVFPLENKEIFVEVSNRNPNTFDVISKKIYIFSDNNWKLFYDYEDDVNFSLFLVFPDKSFYLTSEDDDDLLIKILNQNLKYIKNNRIQFDFENNYWKDFFINSEGKIFSSKIQNHYYTIVEWK